MAEIEIDYIEDHEPEEKEDRLIPEGQRRIIITKAVPYVAHSGNSSILVEFLDEETSIEGKAYFSTMKGKTKRLGYLLRAAGLANRVDAYGKKARFDFLHLIGKTIIGEFEHEKKEYVSEKNGKTYVYLNSELRMCKSLDSMSIPPKKKTDDDIPF
jgi:hypothetical protein